MNSTELANAIQKHSRELDALIASSFTSDLSAIQHELIKQKCTALYDLLLQAKPAEVFLTAQSQTVQLSQATPKKEIQLQPEALDNQEAFVKPEPVPVTLFTAPVSLVNDVPEASEDLVKHKEEPAIDIEEIKTETEIQNKVIDEIIELQHEQSAQEPIPLLKEVINELSLHEKIASVLPPKPDLTERLVTNISSLKSAINVNLKIAMVNDLFNESSVEYVKAIDKLNNSENIHEAMRYFSELKHTYAWETDNALVKELETLIAKRYSA